MSKRNFKVTIEQVRDIQTKNDTDFSLDVFTTFIYKVKNQTNVRNILASEKKLKELRKLGLKITKKQMLNANLTIERL